MLAVDGVTRELVDVNPAAELLTGYSREELIGKHPRMLHSEEESHYLTQAFTDAPDYTLTLSNCSLKTKDGRMVPIRISSAPAAAAGDRSLAIITFTDITEIKETEHKLSTQNWALSAYAAAISAQKQQTSPEALLQSLCEAITCESAYLCAWVGIAEDDPAKTLRIAACAGSAASIITGLNLSWSADTLTGHSTMGACIRANQVQVMQDSENYHLQEWRDRARLCGIRSSVAVPFGGPDIGRCGLLVYAAHPEAFEKEAIDVFQHLAEQIGHGLRAIEQTRLLQAEHLRLEQTQVQLTETLTATVAAMSVTMEMRDPYTAGHEERVSGLAYAIGKKMGWSEDRLLGLRLASLVHDIGKISIPSRILNQVTPLTTAQRALIQEHPETAYQILKDVPFHWPIADMVRQHHEKLDGSGYPLGLKGDEILPESRVLAVADIVEAMASARPFRPALGLDAALAEIERLSGPQLDAEVVRVCVSLFRDHEFQLPIVETV